MLFLLFILGLQPCLPVDSLTPSPANDTTILYRDRFENDTINSFWRKELWSKTSGSITNQISRTGKHSVQIRWKPSQADGTNKMLHAELATQSIFPGETPERWYGYSTYLPAASMSGDSQPAIISQWHAVPADAKAQTVPPIAISVEPGDQLKLVYFSTSTPIVQFRQLPDHQKIIKLGPALFDCWIDFVVHVKWDPTGTAGLLQVWQNGKLVVDEKAISIGYPDQKKPYWKIGLYCWTGKSRFIEKTIYFDDVSIGGPLSNYDAVKPGHHSDLRQSR